MKLEKQEKAEIWNGNKILSNKWQIIDDHNENGAEQIKKMKEKGVDFTDNIFESSCIELKNLFDGYGHEKTTRESLVEECVQVCLPMIKDAASENELKCFFESTRIFTDVVKFKNRILEHGSSDEIIEMESRWIYDASQNMAFKYIGHEAHRILQDSRTIGLVPLEATDKLRNLKIRCMGISAASPAIDALVAAGAEDIKMWDGGRIDPSNQPRFVGMMGEIKNVGRSKAEVMLDILKSRNPYGNYESHCGKVLAEENGDKESISYENFFKDADLVLEVVDDVYTKSNIDEWARINSDNTLMLFMADVGHKPIAGISIPRLGNHFNQKKLSEADIHKMGDRTLGIHPLNLVMAMIGEDMPQDHILQFLLMKNGKMPYWSQTPDASRESASLVSKLILAYLSGFDVVGRNYSSVNIPSNLMSRLSDKDGRILNLLTKRIFLI